MPRRQKVGTGITRHWRITWNLLDPDDRELVKSQQEQGWPDDFTGWLDQREADLAEALERLKLPAPNQFVAFDKGNPIAWRYEVNLYSPGIHARTEAHLQSFPYQSNFWFIGAILSLINQCRSALLQGQMQRAAGLALRLGAVDSQFRLKFSGEKRLADFERHAAGADQGNREKRRKADAWKAEARRIVALNPEINLDNASAAARLVLEGEAWSDHVPEPSQRSLRQYLSTLAKRAVLPEMKKPV